MCRKTVKDSSAPLQGKGDVGGLIALNNKSCHGAKPWRLVVLGQRQREGDEDTGGPETDTHVAGSLASDTGGKHGPLNKWLRGPSDSHVPRRTQNLTFLP